jgi:hypothetical protein
VQPPAPPCTTLASLPGAGRCNRVLLIFSLPSCRLQSRTTAGHEHNNATTHPKPHPHTAQQQLQHCTTRTPYRHQAHTSATPATAQPADTLNAKFAAPSLPSNHQASLHKQ